MSSLSKFFEKVYFRVLMQRDVRNFFRKNFWRLRGMKVGSGVIVARFLAPRPKQVSIGMHCHCEDDIFFKTVGEKSSRGTIIIGNGVFIGRGCEFNITGEVTIGDDCLIASGCKFIDHDHGMELGQNINSQVEIESPICLGVDVWLGANVIVLKGVIIGDGAVVAAGAVVTKSIPSHEIWAGVPAKRISQRQLGCLLDSDA